MPELFGGTETVRYLLALAILSIGCAPSTPDNCPPPNCTTCKPVVTDNEYPTDNDLKDLYSLYGTPDEMAVEIPQEARERNYKGGSCYHASIETVMRMVGRGDDAEWWRQTYAHGESTGRLMRRLDKRGITYAATTMGDVKFLEWATRTRRPCAIPYYPNHAITFVCFHKGNAVLLDNNRTHKYIFVPKPTFVRNWAGRYGGDAICILSSPIPPTPFL